MFGYILYPLRALVPWFSFASEAQSARGVFKQVKRLPVNI